jgi:Fe-S-cluster containining protein
MADSETFTILEGGAFSFACHPAVPCFTECCRDLKLVLTPYDLLRMRKPLGLLSSDLLDQYTIIKPQELNGFPGLFLKMNEDERHICPFVTPKGCRIYHDRPGACRIYPVGRASSKLKGQEEAREFHFLIREAHCRGFEEPKEWTIREWSDDQGLERYNAFNDLWTEIIQHKGSLGPEETIPQKLHMFFMACYNLDQFRAFVFKSTFLQRFDLSDESVEQIKSDDEALLLLAFQWLKLVLFGENAIALKQ